MSGRRCKALRREWLALTDVPPAPATTPWKRLLATVDSWRGAKRVYQWVRGWASGPVPSFLRAIPLLILLALALPAAAEVTVWDGGDAMSGGGPAVGHLPWAQEVAGSNPAPPTTPPVPVTCGLPDQSCGAVHPHVSILGGYLASLSADASGASPLGRVSVSWPLLRDDKPMPGEVVDVTKTPRSARGPLMRADVDLTASPGDTVEVTDVETFKAVEVTLAIEQPLGPKIAARLAMLGGFSSRLATDRFTARDDAPRFGSVGVAFDDGDGSRIFVGAGGDQRLTGDWVLACLVKGSVVLKRVDKGTLKGGALALIGQAILGIDTGTGYGTTVKRRDSVTVGVGIGWP